MLSSIEIFIGYVTVAMCHCEERSDQGIWYLSPLQHIPVREA